jgi:Carboxypeptidase regulatory-like domain
MQKLGFALSILVLPFAFHSIRAQGAAQPAETKAGTATVSGRVTLKGEPARGVTVLLERQNTVANSVTRVRADESGRFQFTGVAAGRYWVSLYAPGFVSPQDGAKTLNLVEGEKVENVDFETKRGGVIAGRVSDSQGRPVIEETINLSKLDKNGKPQMYRVYGRPYNDMYRTDDRGAYRLYGLPEGRYLVSVGNAKTPGLANIAAAREFYPRIFYPKATSESEAKVIEVSAGSEATDIDITVPDPKKTHDIYGRVVDASSERPVAGVEVWVGGLSDDGRTTGSFIDAGVMSGTNGEFRVFGAIPGRYRLLVHSNNPDGGSSGPGYISEPVNVDINEGNATGVEIRVRQGASISGVAVIEGTNDPKILARLSQINFTAYIRRVGPTMYAPMIKRPDRINPDGSFRIAGLQSGKLSLYAAPPPDMRGIMIGRIEVNGAPVPDGIDLDPGEEVTGVRVILMYGTLTLRGEAKIVGGGFPAEQRFIVSTRRVDQQILTSKGAETDAQGRFIIENLTPGEYEIRVSLSNTPNTAQMDPQVMKRLLAFRERVVVASGNQLPVSIVIDLTRKDADK